MALDPAVFEKLGAFYLGRPFDPATGQSEDTPLLYDSRDLVTHAVCVGMTGSGKTGLCLALLEEAAIDDVPAIIIDPKGDLANLLLTFPDLRPEDFRPWINEEDAQRKGVTPDAFAAQQAEMWKTGLASWGEAPSRIRTLREKVDMAIYTPGSTSGLPVNVLASFDAPATDDPEILAERVQTTAASLLGLLKIDADPMKSREYVLLSNLLTHEWTAGRDLDLSTLIERIQHPPFEKVGVLDLETFYPAKDRFALVMALNNVLASPGFATWQQGETLDAQKFLYTAEGKPRLSIFSIAHLGDEERMFFVSLLLNEVLSWTRRQSGTTSLRAIIYMDEIFGYLPPTANPPSKQPLLTLLKQGRAFGVGIVLATQNPVDLDYKALSNAGTWFIGRLQTERDKARVLDGLQGASGGGSFDRGAIERLLAGLGNRKFLMNNVHEDAPVTFETRWVMSYLRGPLTRDQIKRLMAGRRAASSQSPSPAKNEPTPIAIPASPKNARPTLPPSIPQVFLPGGSSDVTYSPRMLGAATVRFSDAKLGVDSTREIILAGPLPDSLTGVNWAAADHLEISLGDLEKTPIAGASYGELSSDVTTAKNYPRWEKDFAAWLQANERWATFRCSELKMTSRPDESEAEFKARLALAAREYRDAAADTLRDKYAPKIAALQTRLARAQTSVQKEKEQASQACMQTFITAGSAILGAFLGRKKISAANIGRAATTARGVGKSWKEGADVATAEQTVEAVRQQLADLETDIAAETAALAAKAPGIETVEIKPARSGITVRLLALGWMT